MNIVHQLFEEDFIRDLFKEKVLSKYPDFSSIKRIRIKPRKDHIWDNTYHVVIEYEVRFVDCAGKNKDLSVFCSAHSSEPRKNLYLALRYLWDNGFGRGLLTVPHPLFYYPELKATFYRGAKGRNFFYFIKENQLREIETTIPQIAAWFAKLHKMPIEGIKNFNKKNSRIRTAIPGRDKILRVISEKYPHFYPLYKNFYNKFIRKEEDFLARTDHRWLVHGDAHPENIIRMGEKKLAVIDFNDLCLSDRARDIGCFLQQFSYMSGGRIADREFIIRMKKLFLEKYEKHFGVKGDEEFFARVDNYSDWTSLRTATYLLLRPTPYPDRAKWLIDELVKKDKYQYEKKS